MICFAITPAYQFPFLLTLPLTPTPSQSYTNRPLWVRALLTSSSEVMIVMEKSVLLKELCVRENARFLPLFSVHTSPRLLTCYHGR